MILFLLFHILYYSILCNTLLSVHWHFSWQVPGILLASTFSLGIFNARLCLGNFLLWAFGHLRRPVSEMISMDQNIKNQESESSKKKEGLQNQTNAHFKMKEHKLKLQES